MIDFTQIAHNAATVGAADEVTTHLDLSDPRYWVPTGPGALSYFHLFDVTHSAWHFRWRVSPGVILPRHYHTGRVIIYTISGQWRYLERDWIQKAGSHLVEAPGDLHTFAVVGDEAVELFGINEGANIIVDDKGKVIDYADVLVRLGQARRHFAENNLDQSLIDSIIR